MKTVNKHPKAPKMLNQMIIQAPVLEDLVVTLSQIVLVLGEGEPNLPGDLRDSLTSTAGYLSGSEEYDSKRLWMILTLHNEAGLQTLIDDHSIDWVILASETEAIDQTPILDFMSDVPEFDEDGDITGYVPVTDVTDILSTYSGHSWAY